MARTPGSNTLRYYPLNATTTYKNYDGDNSKAFIPNGEWVGALLGGVSCLDMRNKQPMYLTGLDGISGASPRTISLWGYKTDENTAAFLYGCGRDTLTTQPYQFCIKIVGSKPRINVATNTSNKDAISSETIENNKWILYTATYDGTTLKLYINGELKGSNTVTLNTDAVSNSYPFALGGHYKNSTSTNKFYGGLSELIIENKARTETEIQSYYNDTAWKYGLAPAPTIFYGGSPIKEMYYGTGVDVWDTQGPCPDGYHVPTKDEWQAVFDMGVALGQWSSSNGDGMRTKLKMPLAGYRNYSSSNVGSQGSNAFYWASTACSNINSSYHLYFFSSGLYPQYNNYRANGFSLRCFKNFPLIPNSSWTTIYEGTGGAGIYHNASEGVISISSDGTNWITIADKNLGAIQVYNDGDTLSEANCGKYYQWGNNYGFPRTGTISKKSTTAVDASAYGPGNYYSSDTFITVNPWDSSDNRNLRGGVSQGVNPGVKEIKEVYYGSKKIRPVGWKPGSNTVAYYPLESDTIDHSGNGNNLTGTVSYVTSENKHVAKFSGSSHLTASSGVISGQTFTISFWVKLNSSSSEQCLVGNANTVSNKDMGVNITKFPSSYNIYGLYGKGTATGWMNTNPVNPGSGTWIHYVSIFVGSNSIKTYYNGNLAYQTNISYNIVYPSVNLSIGGSETRGRNFDGRLSEVILESKARTDTEVSSYFNSTKSNYGL